MGAEVAILTGVREGRHVQQHLQDDQKQPEDGVVSLAAGETGLSTATPRHRPERHSFLPFAKRFHTNVLCVCVTPEGSTPQPDTIDFV